MLGHQEHAREVDAEAPVPRGERQLLDGWIGEVGKARVVDQRVRAAELPHYRPYTGAHGRFPGNVAAEKRQVRLAMHIRHGDAIAARGQELGGCPTDAAAAAGEQDCLLRHS